MTDTLVYNLIDTETTKYTKELETFIEGFGFNIPALTKAFYDQFEDEVDFIFFLYEPPSSPTPDIRFVDVYRPPCPALGIGVGNDWSCDHRSYYGSARRLTSVLKIPLVMDSTEPPHISREIFRNWHGKLAGITLNPPGYYPGWGANSVNGVAGGWDQTTLKDLTGNLIADPTILQAGSWFLRSPYSDYTSDVGRKFAPLELWLMGLVGKEEVMPLYRMLPPTSSIYDSQLRTRKYQSGGFAMLTVDDLIAANSGAPPRAASTAFRAAWVLVSEKPASEAMLAKAEQYARVYGGLEQHVPAAGRPRWLSFAEATGHRASLDVRLPQRVPPLPEQGPPEDLIPGQVTMQTHPNQRFITLSVPQALFDGWATGNYNQTFSNVQYLTKPLYERFKDDFDFIMFVLDLDSVPPGEAYGMACQVSNGVKGIGKDEVDSSKDYGSSGRLKSHFTMWMRTAMENGPFLHELCHQWANHALVTEHYSWSTLKGAPEGKGAGGHWGFSGCGGQLGGFDQSTLQENVDGVAGLYSAKMGAGNTFGMNANGGNGVPYSNMELYLMGLIPAEELTPFDVFTGIDLDGCTKDAQTYSGATVKVWNGSTFKAATRTECDAESIVRDLGPRVPSCKDAQKSFNCMIVVLTPKPALSPEHQKVIDKMLVRQSYPGDSGNDNTYNFFEATRGLGRLSFDLSTSRR